MNLQEETWDIINSYFRDTPNPLSRHQIDSYNDFIQNKIPLVLKNIGTKTMFLYDKDDKDKNTIYEINFHIGGRNHNNFKITKPSIISYPSGTSRILYPNEARLKNLTYGFDFFYGVDIDFTIKKGDDIIMDKIPLPNPEFLQNIYLGKIPIMLQSDVCVLNGATGEMLAEMGECRYDIGGYFILDGQEKTIVSQERRAENIIFLQSIDTSSGSEKYSYTAEIKSISDEAFQYSRNTRVQMEVKGPITIRLGQKNPFLQEREGRDLPIFIMFRCLGIETDREILEYIIGSTNLDTDLAKKMINLLRPSITDPFIINSKIYDKESAESYMMELPTRAGESTTAASTTSKDRFNEVQKNRLSRLAFLYSTLDESFLPHCGTSYKAKAFYLGYMIRKLLLLNLGLEKDTDRDNFCNKRIDLSGFLLSTLFRDAFQQLIYHARISVMSHYQRGYKEYSGENIQYLINETNYQTIFDPEIFKKYFTGQLKKGTIGQKIGIVQALNRKSRNETLAHIRRIIDKPTGSNVTIPRRRLHTTQYGLICPVETPEGQNVGLNKGLAIIAHITFGVQPRPIINFCIENGTVPIDNLTPADMDSSFTKVIVNGNWIGCHRDAFTFQKKFLLYRRNGLINIFVSFTWLKDQNEILIYTDNGRGVRPLYIVENNNLVLQPKHIKDISHQNLKFKDLVSGFRKRKNEFNYYDGDVKSLDEVYLEASDPDLHSKLQDTQAVIEYLDTQEMINSLYTSGFDIAPDSMLKYTHMELHPSMILSFNAHLLPFCQHSAGTRVIYGSKYIKQGISTYATNFNNRIDTKGIILNNPEKPLSFCRIHKHLGVDRIGQGHNVIVAIGRYNGYNQEDSILANGSSLDMGLYNTTHYSSYYDKEMIDSKTGQEDRFFNPLYTHEMEQYPDSVGINKDLKYDDLDKWGLIREGTIMEKDKVVIGKYMKLKDEKGNEVYKDASTTVKKDNEGSFVDKVFTWQSNANGDRAVKIRTCKLRKPVIGDKFASRCSQKGTFGMIIPRQDMPYFEDGLVPDIMLDPAGYPGRMTVAQLMDVLFGNLAVEIGMFGNYNAFETVNIEQVGDILQNNLGMTYMGDRVMYSGLTGQQMEFLMFSGVIHYQRLPYMTDDKINVRYSGKRMEGMPVPGGAYTARERQVVEGRANDGGLRFGEMERDVLIAHGIFGFLRESYMDRGDKFIMYVSRETGEISVGNPKENIFYDTLKDGPVSYMLEEGGGDKGGVTPNKILGLNMFGQKSKEFIRIEVPYAFKLMVQEIQGWGCRLKLDVRSILSKLEEEDLDDEEVITIEGDIEQLISLEDLTGGAASRKSSKGKSSKRKSKNKSDSDDNETESSSSDDSNDDSNDDSEESDSDTNSNANSNDDNSEDSDSDNEGNNEENNADNQDNVQEGGFFDDDDATDAGEDGDEGEETKSTDELQRPMLTQGLFMGGGGSSGASNDSLATQQPQQLQQPQLYQQPQLSQQPQQYQQSQQSQQIIAEYNPNLDNVDTNSTAPSEIDMVNSEAKADFVKAQESDDAAITNANLGMFNIPEKQKQIEQARNNNVNQMIGGGSTNPMSNSMAPSVQQENMMMSSNNASSQAGIMQSSMQAPMQPGLNMSFNGGGGAGGSPTLNINNNNNNNMDNSQEAKGVSFDSNIKVIELSTDINNGYMYGGNKKQLDPFH